MSEIGFETHRCDAMPRGFSLRCYEVADRRHQWPEPGGWVLGFTDYDYEWMCAYLHDVNPWARDGMHFCPWCGERLE